MAVNSYLNTWPTSLPLTAVQSSYTIPFPLAPLQKPTMTMGSRSDFPPGTVELLSRKSFASRVVVATRSYGATGQKSGKEKITRRPTPSDDPNDPLVSLVPCPHATETDVFVAMADVAQVVQLWASHGHDHGHFHRVSPITAMTMPQVCCRGPANAVQAGHTVAVFQTPEKRAARYDWPAADGQGDPAERGGGDVHHLHPPCQKVRPALAVHCVDGRVYGSRVVDGVHADGDGAVSDESAQGPCGRYQRDCRADECTPLVALFFWRHHLLTHLTDP